MLGVCFFNHGTKCLSRLVVSIFSLRRHYSGPIAILDTGESNGIVQQIAADPRADIERVVKIQLAPVRRHACYVTKASLWRWSPFETTIFLDSDTIVDGDVLPLGQAAEASISGLAITRFSNWTTHTPIIAKRIDAWRELDPAAVEASERHAWPAINTGVMAWRQPKNTSPVLAIWEGLTRLGWRRFISDEIAMQLILPEVAHEIACLPSRWNHSPRYGVDSPDGPPVVLHYHGSSHTKSHGLPTWWPIFRQALAENFGELSSWSGPFV